LERLGPPNPERLTFGEIRAFFDRAYPSFRDGEKKGKEEIPLIQIPKSIIALSICILKYLKADGIYLNSLLSLIRFMARFGR